MILRVFGCETSSEIYDDVDVTNCYSSNKRTERGSRMNKKVKIRFAGVIMCVAMIISSMSVFAGSTSRTFGTSTSTGYATLFAGDGYVYATTSNEYGKTVSTSVRAVGSYGSSSWYSGTTSAACDAVASCIRGESNHFAGVESTFLTVSYN